MACAKKCAAKTATAAKKTATATKKAATKKSEAKKTAVKATVAKRVEAKKDVIAKKKPNGNTSEIDDVKKAIDLRDSLKNKMDEYVKAIIK